MVGLLFLEVASVTFADSAKIDYYMSDSGFAKSSSLAPCAVWMCKAGFEDAKAMFTSHFMEETIEFSDAQGS